MPVLRDCDVVVPDSSVIAAYLERKHPSPRLFPEAPAELARALFLEEYADARMAEGMGPIVFERLIKPHMLGQPTDEARLKELQEAAAARWFGKATSATGQPVPCVMDYLESQLANGRDSVLAANGRDSVLAAFSIADVALGAHLGWPGVCGLELDARRWPRTARYAEALAKRPSFLKTQL
jgi:glutathione S-transferase